MYTSDDFILALRRHYATAREGKRNAYLSKPTRSGIRNLCLELAHAQPHPTDKSILQQFFKPSSESDIDLIKAIKGFDNDLFRPVENFLTGRNKTQNRVLLNLIALLIDFEPRPLKNFIDKKQGINDEFKPEKQDLIEEVPQEPDNKTPPPPLREDLVGAEEMGNHQPRKVVRFPKPRFPLWMCLAVFPLLLGGIFLKCVDDEEKCMIWNKKNYVYADCKLAVAEPYDASQFELREIFPKKDDTFFRNQVAVVWYCRRNGYHFFNRRGFDPISGKPLHPITYAVLKSRGWLN